jgi:pimeloyl-ACP methyl ester carboxylesterase
MSPEDLAKALAPRGRANIRYLDRYSPERPLVLECFRPQAHNPDKPVVIVQHGASRNGAQYCEAWMPAAERHGPLIVAITFPKEAWPDAATYNNGHVRDEEGSVRPRECWSQAIPGRVFPLLREAGVTRCERAYLWGHSAGGQFVHRLLATQPHNIFEAVGAANPGWYTLPTLDLRHPDGLGGIGLTGDDIVRFLDYPLVIFSGDQDIDGRPRTFRGTTARWRRGRTDLHGRSSTSTAGRRKRPSSACPATGAVLSCRVSRIRRCGCRPSPAIIGSGPRANAVPREYMRVRDDAKT